MNWNLTIFAFTIIALGALATFDVIPGTGFFAGLAMPLTGVLIVIVQLIARDTSLLSPLASSVRPNAVAGE